MKIDAKLARLERAFRPGREMQVGRQMLAEEAMYRGWLRYMNAERRIIRPKPSPEEQERLKAFTRAWMRYDKPRAEVRLRIVDKEQERRRARLSPRKARQKATS